MKNLQKTKPSVKEILIDRYPKVKFEEMPERENCPTLPVEFKKTEIELFNVIFWYRLLKEIYQEPSEIDRNILDRKAPEGKPKSVISLRNKGSGKGWDVGLISEDLSFGLKSGELIWGLGENWRYFARLPSGRILELGSQDSHTLFSISLESCNFENENTTKKETEKFISLLLKWANQRKKHLFDPKNEFKRGKNLKFYQLRNVYLSNYFSAEAMLQYAISEEPKILKEAVRFDHRIDRYDKEKMAHTYSYFHLRGMFYLSSITYFIMAFEGFVNLLFHSFLKKDHRDKNLKIEKRLDLELKLRLMSSLCRGFRENKDVLSGILEDFLKLRNSRNIFFHSKVDGIVKSQVAKFSRNGVVAAKSAFN
ncbi:MAG: hypothetical protein ABIJ42_05860, partial [Acidobacteriota bacterium]